MRAPGGRRSQAHTPTAAHAASRAAQTQTALLIFHDLSFRDCPQPKAVHEGEERLFEDGDVER